MRKYSLVGLLLVFTLGVSAGAIGCSRLQNTPVTDPTQLTQGLNDFSFKGQSTTPATAVLPAAGDIGDVKTTEDQVIKDLQADILYLFKAWKAADMDEFKRIAAMGFSSSAFEARVSEAESVIVDGLGADVNNINYKSIKLVKLEENTATLETEYSYSGYDYNVTTATRGEKFPPVDIKATYVLEKIDNRWVIVKENQDNL